ncbi:hypothetical protein [Microbacterium sp. XT11]|uniref:hypothetical protein n=1 Tax=Microbacterium sp. XT11 TaxID=367477 RepID=UPI00082F1817|nr:hypothetical protein [Microbacterium sp. XT11]
MGDSFFLAVGAGRCCGPGRAVRGDVGGSGQEVLLGAEQIVERFVEVWVDAVFAVDEEMCEERLVQSASYFVTGAEVELTRVLQ